MKFALKLGTFFGISVFLHWSFALVPLWIISQGMLAQLSWISILTQLGLTLAVFGCVLLHEYGHALAARRFGIRTRDIVLTPIGGLARLEGMPRDPLQEFIIAIAGPAVNVVIAALLAPLVLLIPGSLNLTESDVTLGGMLKVLFAINVILVLFNAIPAFPMDGGRVLRSLLAFFMPYLQATTIAARVGQVIAVLFFVVALVSGQVGLMFIGMFVFFLAAMELQSARWLEQRRIRSEHLQPRLQGLVAPHLTPRFLHERETYWRFRQN